MPIIKRDSFRSGPKPIKRASDTKGDKYPVKRTARRPDDSREERNERSERPDRGERRPGPRSYGYDKRESSDKRDGYERRDREPMHVMRRSTPPATQEAPRGASASVIAMQPVPAYKLKKGLEEAKKDITDMIEAISAALAESYNVGEVELAVGFNAEGKFLGFGEGGVVTIKIRIAPTD